MLGETLAKLRSAQVASESSLGPAPSSQMAQRVRIMPGGVVQAVLPAHKDEGEGSRSKLRRTEETDEAAAMGTDGLNSGYAGTESAGTWALPTMVQAPNKILVSASGEADVFEDVDNYIEQFMMDEQGVTVGA